MKTLFLLIFSLLFLTMGQGQVCDCEENPSPQVASEQADIIFSGKVIHVNTNWMSGGMKFTFEVEQYWKKRVDSYYVVNSGWESKDCGYVFEKGRRYLVYVKRKFSPKTDRCSGNKLLEAAKADLQFLGPGSPPAPSPGLARMNWILVLLTIAGLLFIAFVVLRKKIVTKA